MNVRDILDAVLRVYQADPAYRTRPDVLAELHRISVRLNQPIRIALAGTLKSGKSTLVNALVGECIAPTDATEATRIVTWYRHGAIPKASANLAGGRRGDDPDTGTAEGGRTLALSDRRPAGVAGIGA
ncbi:MAG: dynamin family protein, partial [Mycobacterium sp.]|nr:dynamin family protein [Mycobacterium sp.]